MLAYVHPIFASLVLALLVYSASLGTRARTERRARAALLERHARLAPWVYVAILVNFAGGLASTWLLRPASELASSGHFKIGCAVVGVMSLSALSSKWMHQRQVRALHPWFGAAAVLLAAAQVFFGLQILP